MHVLGVFVAAIEPGNFGSQFGFNSCKRFLADSDAEPYVYFEERRQRRLARCRERVKAGTNSKGTPPDAVAAAIEHALFDQNPKHRYMVVPRQVEAGWTIAQAMQEMLALNARHDHSYTRDELVMLMDAFWPFAIDEKSFDNEEDEADIEAFFEVWATRRGTAAE